MTDELKKLAENLRSKSQGIGYGVPMVDMPKFHKLEIPVDQNLASEFYKRLVKWINNFDSSLDNEFEVGVRLVNFGQSVTFHLQNIGYSNPSLISFSGSTEQGEPVELIQHVSQISILLLKVKRQDTLKPKRPIGFHDWSNQESK